MEAIYKNYLFTKHILVNDYKKENNHAFSSLYSFAHYFNIKIVKGKHLATEELIEFISGRLGRYIPEPFYKGFPNTVKALSKDELLFDQLLSYYLSYDLDNFEEPLHSIMEEKFEKVAFNEQAPIRFFDILSEEEANKQLFNIVTNLLSSKRPLNIANYTLVLNYLRDFPFDVQKCASKDTAIRFLIDSKNLCFTKFLILPDFIKVVDYLNFFLYLNKDVKKLNLKNKDRVFLSGVLDILLGKNNLFIDACFEKQHLWCGILHHLHYKPKTDSAQDFVNLMRKGKNISAYSLFEKAVSKKDINKASCILVKQKSPATLLRHLNYLLSRCQTEEEIATLLKKITTDNNIVLIQLLLMYANYNSEQIRTFKFSRFGTLTTHVETKKEFASRKSRISSELAQKVSKILLANLENNLKNKLGKVYISEEMKKIALPIQENTSMGGFGILPKGSKISLPQGKKIRAFTYWEKVNDIDLSIIGIDENLKQHEFSWRSMFENQSDAITFSGDQTSGYYGGSEYFDIDLDEIKNQFPNIKYYVFCNNVYSGTNFDECICRAGFMMRDTIDSGEVFEPKTVTSSYTVNCLSTFAYMFALDVEKREIIWLNVAKESSEIIAGRTNLLFLMDYFNMTSVINMFSLFKMMATEIVSSPSNADIIVCDEEIDIKEGSIQIKSYDTDKIIALIN